MRYFRSTGGGWELGGEGAVLCGNVRHERDLFGALNAPWTGYTDVVRSVGYSHTDGVVRKATFFNV